MSAAIINPCVCIDRGTIMTDHSANRKRGRSDQEGKREMEKNERTIDEEVEEFFAIIRRIRDTSRMLKKKKKNCDGCRSSISICNNNNNNNQYAMELSSPPFQREGLSSSCHDHLPVAVSAAASEENSEALDSKPIDRSSARLVSVCKEHLEFDETAGEVEEEERKGHDRRAEDQKVIPAWLDLSLGFSTVSDGQGFRVVDHLGSKSV